MKIPEFLKLKDKKFLWDFYCTDFGYWLLDKKLKVKICDGCGKLAPKWSISCGYCEDCWNIENSFQKNLENETFAEIFDEKNSDFIDEGE